MHCIGLSHITSSHVYFLYKNFMKPVEKYYSFVNCILAIPSGLSTSTKVMHLEDPMNRFSCLGLGRRLLLDLFAL